MLSEVWGEAIEGVASGRQAGARVAEPMEAMLEVIEF